MTVTFKQASLICLLITLVLLVWGQPRRAARPATPPNSRPAARPTPKANRPGRPTHFPPDTDPDVAETIKNFDQKARQAATDSYLKTKAAFAAAHAAHDAHNARQA